VGACVVDVAEQIVGASAKLLVEAGEAEHGAADRGSADGGDEVGREM
jgi:hypothetical protein